MVIDGMSTFWRMDDLLMENGMIKMQNVQLYENLHENDGKF